MSELPKADLQFAATALKNMVNGICNVCGTKVEKERQVGRSVYSETCGHRLYQGEVGAMDGVPPSPDSETPSQGGEA